MSPHVVVVGAGIGGLTAAIGLKKAGCTVEVHERAHALQPVGAGLTIQPNAVLALRHLGLGDAVEKAGHALKAGGVFRADGKPLSLLTESDGRALLQQVGAGIVGIHRATLHELLLRAVGSDRVHLSRTCVGADIRDDGVRVRFSDGSEVTADAVIGADGIHSALRQQLLGDGEPVYAGYYSWRGIAPGPGSLGPDWAGEFWGSGVRFGGCVIDGGRCYWFAVASGPGGQHEEPARGKAHVLARFSEFSAPIRELISSTPAEAIFRTDIADRPPVTHWGEGRLTLLGDAAHPMTPNLGQGACQAIEDALVLALEVRRGGELGGAFRSYEKRRQPRVNAVVTAARRVGAVGQWQNPVARGVRNLLFGAMPASALRRQLADSWTLPYEPLPQ